MIMSGSDYLKTMKPIIFHTVIIASLTASCILDLKGTMNLEDTGPEDMQEDGGDVFIEENNDEIGDVPAERICNAGELRCGDGSGNDMHNVYECRDEFSWEKSRDCHFGCREIPEMPPDARAGCLPSNVGNEVDVDTGNPGSLASVDSDSFIDGNSDVYGWLLFNTQDGEIKRCNGAQGSLLDRERVIEECSDDSYRDAGVGKDSESSKVWFVRDGDWSVFILGSIDLELSLIHI